MDREECRHKLERLGCCVVIPTYDNAGTLADVIEGVLGYCSAVIVVNDGSRDGTAEILASFGERITVISSETNMGKGHALNEGLGHAKASGYSYAITIDSDGQHFPADIPAFAEAIEKHPGALIVGARDLQADGMPGKNTFANRFSNFWFRIETGIRLEDTQSGYRAYPLTDTVLHSNAFTDGYEFELEALVFSAWKGTEVINIPVHVYYPPEGERVSHFKPFRDFTKISILNTVLVLYCLLWRWPAGFFRKLTWTNIKGFIDRNIIHSGESDARIASAIAVGAFMGVMPIWGYQMISALALAHLLKLNKVIVLVASNISLPPLIPFIVFGGYWTGCRIFGSPVTLSFRDAGLDSIGEVMLQYVVGSIVAGFFLAVAIWAMSMLLLTIFRRNPKG